MTPEIIVRSFSDDQYYLDKIFYSNYYRIKNFEEDSIVVDVGAHIGYFSILCAMRGANKIYNVEPFTENYKVLSRNTESFLEKVENLKLGIYSENKLANLAYPKFENNFFLFSKACFNPEAELFDLNSFVTLDNLLQSINEPKITLLKINMGYAEIDILKSSNEINRCEYICGETLSDEGKLGNLTKIMHEKGFKDSYFAKSSDQEESFIFMFAKEKCDKLFDLSNTENNNNNTQE